MPRTKISKNSKRNRDAANREEKIRFYESKMETFQFTFDRLEDDIISEIEMEFRMLTASINEKLLHMKMSDFLELNLNKFKDWVNQNISMSKNLALTNSNNSTHNNSLCNSTQPMLQRSAKVTNPNDEGYLTEDSTTGSSGSASLAAYTSGSSLTATASLLRTQSQQRVLRTPGGPMASARLRRPRRSRSASGDLVHGSAIKPQMSAQRQPGAAASSEHQSRNKLRTPMASRSKALSVDRTTKLRTDRSVSPNSPPTAILRWPKPGELVLSTCGSPLVAQVMSDKFANVNIPVRNGVLSLQPKKIGQLNKDIIDAIDPNTLSQIRTLHENLNLIMNLADKTATK